MLPWTWEHGPLIITSGKNIVLIFFSLSYTFFFSLHINGGTSRMHTHMHTYTIHTFLILLEKWFPLRGERAHSLKLFCMYDKRFEILKTK